MIPGWTLDRPAPGVAVAQPARGFRYGAEAFWVAGFALEGEIPVSAADLGTGSGVIALLLATVGIDVTGFELRAEWEAGWTVTLASSQVSGHVRFQRADVAASLPGRFPLVVSNPPFFAASTGPVASDAWRAAARTESTASLRDFLASATALLAPNGRFCFVVPREREREVVGTVAVGRQVRVGSRRTLFEVQPGTTGPCQSDSLDEADERVVGWTRRFQVPR